jgi:hypothetical protein
LQSCGQFIIPITILPAFSRSLSSLREDGLTEIFSSTVKSLIPKLPIIPRAPKELPVTAHLRNIHGVAEWKLFLKD